METYLPDRAPDMAVFYKTVGELRLPMQIYLPEGFDQGRRYPLAVVIHGGAWHAVQTPLDMWDGGHMRGNAKYFARRGYVAVAFSYRDISLPDTDIRDLVSDCADALAYIKEQYRFVDTDNCFLIGDSAGAHLALCLGMSIGCTPAILPRAIVACNPVSDCLAEPWKEIGSEELRRAFSPLWQPKKIGARLLVMHGDADHVVPIEDSRRFSREMQECGNDVTFVPLAGLRHAFVLFDYRREIPDVLETHAAIDAFLQARQGTAVNRKITVKAPNGKTVYCILDGGKPFDKQLSQFLGASGGIDVACDENEIRVLDLFHGDVFARFTILRIEETDLPVLLRWSDAD